MTLTRAWIEDMVTRIQNAFLGTPALTLTPFEARRRFGVDTPVGEAILGALAEAGVLYRGGDGAYARLFPRGVTFEPVPTRHAA